MKKLTAFLLMLGMLTGLFLAPVQAEDTGNTDPFADRDTINVVYLGGSITAGAGASDKSKIWVNQVHDYFTERYSGQKTVNRFNVGVGGTGSDYGILRLERDVISKAPDLVFVEFAVNDGGRNSTRYMESIVRSLQRLDKVPYIIFLYTTQVSGTKDNYKLDVNHSYHENVAQYYGIRSIDLQAAMQRKMDAMTDTNNILEYFGNGLIEGHNDFTHPNEKGYQVYADEILSKLPDNSYFRRPKAQEKKLSALSQEVSAAFTAAKDEKVVKTGTWTEESGYLKSTVPDSKLSFDFTGNILALEHRLHKNAGQYSISVDYSKPVTVDSFYANNNGQLVVGYQNFNLGRGKHHIEITVLDSKNENSDGSEGVSFYNFIANEDVTSADRIYEDFESRDLTSVNPALAKYEWTDEETAGGSAGAVKVTTNAGGNNNTNALRFRFNDLRKGQEYRISAKVKLNHPSSILIDRVSAILYFKKLDEAKNPTVIDAYMQIAQTDIGLMGEDGENPWVTLEGKFTYSGKARQVGVGEVDVTDFGTVEIRVGGDQQMEGTTGNASDYIEYYLDDMILEPAAAEPPAPSDPNVLFAEDFEDGFVNGKNLTADKCNVVTEGIIRAIEGGQTSKAVQIAETGNMGALRRNQVNIPLNQACRLSFWVKTDDEAAVAEQRELRAIFEKKTKDNSGYGSNYFEGKKWTLTKEWQYCETVIYRNIVSYTDDLYDFYFRTGANGDKRTVYQMDDIKLEKLDMPYNGSFDSNVSGAWNAKSTITYVNEAGAPNAPNGYVRITNTNTEFDELTQGVDIKPGIKYHFSFWAKAESVDDSKYTDGKLPVTVIFNRAMAADKANSEYKGANYEYLPSFPAEPNSEDYQKCFMMSSEWQKFEFDYQVPQAMITGYRIPKIMIRAGSNSEATPATRTARTYCLDEFKITPIIPEDKMNSFTCSTNTPEVGDTLQFEFSYDNAAEMQAYMWRVYQWQDEEKATLAQGITAQQQFSVVIPPSAAGKKLTAEVIPVAKTGEWRYRFANEDDVKVGNTFAVEPVLPDEWSENITAQVRYTNDAVPKDIFVILALYQADNVLYNVIAQTENLSGREGVISIPALSAGEAAYAKLFVWQGTELMTPCGAAVLEK